MIDFLQRARLSNKRRANILMNPIIGLIGLRNGKPIIDAYGNVMLYKTSDNPKIDGAEEVMRVVRGKTTCPNCGKQRCHCRPSEKAMAAASKELGGLDNFRKEDGK